MIFFAKKHFFQHFFCTSEANRFRITRKSGTNVSTDSTLQLIYGPSRKGYIKDIKNGHVRKHNRSIEILNNMFLECHNVMGKLISVSYLSIQGLHSEAFILKLSNQNFNSLFILIITHKLFTLSLHVWCSWTSSRQHHPCYHVASKKHLF